MPSLPATNDGSAKPLAEVLSTSPGSEEDFTCDAGSELGATEAEVAPDATEAEAEPGQANPAAEAPAAGLDVPHQAGEPHQAEVESGAGSDADPSLAEADAEFPGTPLRGDGLDAPKAGPPSLVRVSQAGGSARLRPT